MINSKDFNRDFIAKVDTPYYKGLVGYEKLLSMLAPKAEKVLDKVCEKIASSLNAQKVVLKPFHGETYIFYVRP